MPKRNQHKDVQRFTADEIVRAIDAVTNARVIPVCCGLTCFLIPPPCHQIQRRSDCTASKAPQKVIAIVCVSMPYVRHLNATLVMKCVHVVQPLAKATRRHSDFYDKGKVAGNGLAARSAFVAAGHLVVWQRTPRNNPETKPRKRTTNTPHAFGIAPTP